MSDFLLQVHFQQQEQVQSTYNEKLEEVSDKVDKAYILPRWLVIFFFVMLAVTLFATGFAIYFQKFKQKQETALRHYQGFMDEVPQAKILYEKWLKENSNQAQ